MLRTMSDLFNARLAALLIQLSESKSFCVASARLDQTLEQWQQCVISLVKSGQNTNSDTVQKFLSQKTKIAQEGKKKIICICFL